MMKFLRTITLPKNLFVVIYILLFFPIGIGFIIQAIVALIGIPYELSGKEYVGFLGFAIALLAAPFVTVCFTLPLWGILKIGYLLLLAFLFVFDPKNR